MKITVFTANQSRHNYLVNLLSNISEELFVIQENIAISSPTIPRDYPVTETMKKYFSNVIDAQKKLFGNTYINRKNKNIRIHQLELGELNKCSLKISNNFLNSNIYIVFGSSYIKGELVQFLVKKKAINIHMGISPYYRGADCNFWALYDGNSHLVGSTIHFLSKGLDSGSILYHALSEKVSDPFLYPMSTVKSAFYSLLTKIKDQSIFKIKEQTQDKSKQLRYSKKMEFTDKVVKEFLNKKINMTKEIDLSLFKDPYLLKKEKFCI